MSIAVNPKPNRAMRRAEAKQIRSAKKKTLSPKVNSAVPYTSVPFDRLMEKGFNEEDAKIHDKLFNPAAYPHIYNDERWEFEEGATVIPMDQIIHDEKEVTVNGQTLYQPVRSTSNKGYDRIKASIEEQGWQLPLPLPIVRRIVRQGMPDLFSLSEGRNRKGIIRNSPNMLVHVVTIKKDSDAFVLGMKCNADANAKGESTIQDYISGIVHQVRSDSLDIGVPLEEYLKLTGEKIKNAKNARMLTTLTTTAHHRVADFLHDISNGTLRKHDFKNIINKVFDQVSINPAIIDHIQGAGAKDRLKELGYVDHGHTKYFTFSGDESKEVYLLKMVLNWLHKDPKNSAQIVHYAGSPDRDRPVESWLSSTRDSANRMEKLFQDIGRVYYGGAEFIASRLYSIGALPQLKCIEHKVPMDKLVTIEELNKLFPLKESD